MVASLQRTMGNFLAIPLLVLFVSAVPSLSAAETNMGYEPADGKSYFGFTYRSWDSTDSLQGDTRIFTNRYSDAVSTELAGKVPSLFAVPMIWQKEDGTMVPFSNALGIINKFHALHPNAAPFISWNAQTGWNVTSGTYSGIITKTVVSGSFDGYIRQYAQDVKAYGRPVFIRPICGEANGNWWKNCSPRANPTLSANDFISAWRRVADIFNQERVTNVAWVWNMMKGDRHHFNFYRHCAILNICPASPA